MRMGWIMAVAALLLTAPVDGEAGGLPEQEFHLNPLPPRSQPVARSASRMFPHGHPLHICGDPDVERPWLDGAAPANPWASLTERSFGNAGTQMEWMAGSAASH